MGIRMVQYPKYKRTDGVPNDDPGQRRWLGAGMQPLALGSPGLPKLRVLRQTLSHSYWCRKELDLLAYILSVIYIRVPASVRPSVHVFVLRRKRSLDGFSLNFVWRHVFRGRPVVYELYIFLHSVAQAGSCVDLWGRTGTCAMYRRFLKWWYEIFEK